MIRFLSCVAVLLLGLGTHVARAELVACPDRTSAVQLNACPGEDELRFTYRGYCSDNQRMYDQGSQLCLDYETYRKAKNVSLWESADGKFDGYLSCDASVQGRAEAAQTQAVKVSTKGTLTTVACTYGDGVVFTYRTKARCVADAGDCGKDLAACRATCE